MNARRLYIIVLSVVTFFALVWIFAPAPNINVDDMQRPPSDRITPICWNETCADVPGASALVNEMRHVCASRSVEVYAESRSQSVRLSARCRLGDSEVSGLR